MTVDDKFSKALGKFVNSNNLRFTAEKYEDMVKDDTVLYTRAEIAILNERHNDILDISVIYNRKDTVSSIYKKITLSYAKALLAYRLRK